MVAVLVIVAVVVVIAVVILVRRREPDTLDSFRRQIDALSPEARRPVVDQVHRLEEAESAEHPGTAETVTDPVTDPIADAVADPAADRSADDLGSVTDSPPEIDRTVKEPEDPEDDRGT